MNFKESFLQAKKDYLNRKFSRMNDKQKEAVFHINGPLLILAGAGSGKTTVLVNRIAYMVNFGNAYHSHYVPQSVSKQDIDFLMTADPNNPVDNSKATELIADYPVRPWNILAITFTNKAAGELKERLENILGSGQNDVNAGTFHSICVRILRREIQNLDYKSSFTIYDTDDSQRVIKDCLKQLNISEKMFPPRQILSEISHSKDRLLTYKDYAKEAMGDYRKGEIAKVFELYQKTLKKSNALDFDDIICLTVELFKNYPEILRHYQNIYKYILVDEYQDTNHAQYMLVSLLSMGHKNLCVVGDDDQSIYRFRGATIENILSFENQFENAFVVKLEQNYRSTQNILDAANAVISNNMGRKGKNLWTENGQGSKLELNQSYDETGESRYVADTITKMVAAGDSYNDFAVLYRMNAQSNSLERIFIKSAIPYKIIGGTKFFDRKEIKDALAYMHIVANPADETRLKRIINEPKRGIGEATLSKATQISAGTGIPMIDIFKDSITYTALSSRAKQLTAFADMVANLIEINQQKNLDEFFDDLLEITGYMDYMLSLGDEGTGRIENLKELKSNIIKYMQENEEPTLNGFLEEVALYTDLDSLNEEEEKVTMMTLHSAKGLEFPYVFIVGMEDNIFPGAQALYNSTEMEEERRLAYVGITRAKKKLFITTTECRMIYGKTGFNPPSRFIKEIPSELIESSERQTHTSYTKINTENKSYTPVRNISVSVDNKKSEPAVIDYKTGDKVLHSVFGEGTVLDMTPMAGDYLVTVNFKKVGTKKIMANFAKLKKQ